MVGVIVTIEVVVVVVSVEVVIVTIGVIVIASKIVVVAVVVVIGAVVVIIVIVVVVVVVAAREGRGNALKAGCKVMALGRRAMPRLDVHERKKTPKMST